MKKFTCRACIYYSRYLPDDVEPRPHFGWCSYLEDYRNGSKKPHEDDCFDLNDIELSTSNIIYKLDGVCPNVTQVASEMNGLKKKILDLKKVVFERSRRVANLEHKLKSQEKTIDLLKRTNEVLMENETK